MRTFFSIFLAISLYISQQHCLAESIESHSHKNVNHHHHHHGEEHKHAPLESIPEADLCCQPMIQTSAADFSKKSTVTFDFFKMTRFLYQSFEVQSREVDLKRALKSYRYPPDHLYQVNLDILLSSPNSPPLSA